MADALNVPAGFKPQSHYENGGLAGLYYGLEAIPERWLGDLAAKDNIDSCIHSFDSYYARSSVFAMLTEEDGLRNSDERDGWRNMEVLAVFLLYMCFSLVISLGAQRARDEQQQKAEEQCLEEKQPKPEQRKEQEEKRMTRDFFEKFPDLWVGFEERIKAEIVKRLEETSTDTNIDWLSPVYQNIGFQYWCSHKGEGFQWKEQLDEVFFEIRYYNTVKLLYQYQNLDKLAAPYLVNRNPEQPEETYGKAIKPLIDTRKQELMDAFAQMAKELANPLPYTWKMPVDDRETALQLGFRKKYRKRNPWDGMDGYTYVFNGRTYKDIQAFTTGALEKLSPAVSIAKDTFGDMVLRRYTEIPTFDSSDREWDSAQIEYLMFDGKDIHLIVMGGGYRIAQLTFYEKLLTADARMKPIFEKLGWPADTITWN